MWHLGLVVVAMVAHGQRITAPACIRVCSRQAQCSIGSPPVFLPFLIATLGMPWLDLYQVLRAPRGRYVAGACTLVMAYLTCPACLFVLTLVIGIGHFRKK
jgi:hypothetical protein